jgi:hypothetical protein
MALLSEEPSAIMGLISRAYTYLFEFAASAALIALALLAMTGDVANFRLPILPWEGATLARACLALGIIGLVVIVLAITRLFRVTLPVWALVVFILLFRGWFASSYTFTNASGFRIALWITLASLVAFLCSFSIFRRDKKKF